MVWHLSVEGLTSTRESRSSSRKLTSRGHRVEPVKGSAVFCLMAPLFPFPGFILRDEIVLDKSFTIWTSSIL